MIHHRIEALEEGLVSLKTRNHLVFLFFSSNTKDSFHHRQDFLLKSRRHSNFTLLQLLWRELVIENFLRIRKLSERWLLFLLNQLHQLHQAVYNVFVQWKALVVQSFHDFVEYGNRAYDEARVSLY